MTIDKKWIACKYGELNDRFFGGSLPDINNFIMKTSRKMSEVGHFYPFVGIENPLGVNPIIVVNALNKEENVKVYVNGKSVFSINDNFTGEESFFTRALAHEMIHVYEWCVRTDELPAECFCYNGFSEICGKNPLMYRKDMAKGGWNEFTHDDFFKQECDRIGKMIGGNVFSFDDDSQDGLGVVNCNTLWVSIEDVGRETQYLLCNKGNLSRFLYSIYDWYSGREECDFPVISILRSDGSCDHKFKKWVKFTTVKGNYIMPSGYYSSESLANGGIDVGSLVKVGEYTRSDGERDCMKAGDWKSSVVSDFDSSVGQYVSLFCKRVYDVRDNPSVIVFRKKYGNVTFVSDYWIRNGTDKSCSVTTPRGGGKGYIINVSVSHGDKGCVLGDMIEDISNYGRMYDVRDVEERLREDLSIVRERLLELCE